ncbi:MAG: Flp pilus assembly protein CpaB [Rhizobiales bacterium 65-9]|nr:Flp pilus assembly protein CpaB [Hyphomicrobiales bacterium]OJY37421.1 MAG: Flp pilus assembly protein CpaB [Rhizobiales bacterium 65-9]
MKRTARLAILGIALFAGLLAAFLVSRQPAPQAPVIVQAPQPAVSNTVDVLIAAGDLAVGTVLKPEQVAWSAWPASSQSPHLIRKSDKPNAKEEVVNAIVRVGMLDGEPIRADKLIKPDGSSGFMSAILPSGMRALAVSIDRTGSSNAGGFILPNDRVDVIRTARNESASKAVGTDVFDSETILTNIRVLAIGQKVEEGADGQKYITGDTATLELDAKQVEILSLAQKQGTISLALRSLVDRQEASTSQPREKDGDLTIVRFGVSNQTGR